MFDFKTLNRYGKLNILVNNAGKVGERFSTIEHTTEEEWDEFHSVNAKGAFFVSKYRIPVMRHSVGVSIIFKSG